VFWHIDNVPLIWFKVKMNLKEYNRMEIGELKKLYSEGCERMGEIPEPALLGNKLRPGLRKQMMIGYLLMFSSLENTGTAISNCNNALCELEGL